MTSDKRIVKAAKALHRHDFLGRVKDIEREGRERGRH